MSTRFFLRLAPGPFAASESLSTQQGEAAIDSDSNTTADGPQQRQVGVNGVGATWYSAPLKAGSVTGTLTLNLWGRESNVLANVGFYVTVDQVTNIGGFLGTILASAEGVELGTSNSVHNWSDSITATFSEGDRIRVRVYGVDAGGTMAASYRFLLTFGGLPGLNGDSWIEFSDDLVLDVFPTPLHDGPQYLKYLKRKKDYKEITVFSQFEDGGVDSLEHAADASQRYELTYDGLGDFDADVLDSYWDAHRLSSPFTFYEPRDEPWTHIEGEPVEVYFESFDGDHEKVDSQSRKVVLIKRPA